MDLDRRHSDRLLATPGYRELVRGSVPLCASRAIASTGSIPTRSR